MTLTIKQNNNIDNNKEIMNIETISLIFRHCSHQSMNQSKNVRH